MSSNATLKYWTYLSYTRMCYTGILTIISHCHGAGYWRRPIKLLFKIINGWFKKNVRPLTLIIQ